MKKVISVLIVLFFSSNTYSQSFEKEFPKSITIKVSNPLDVARENAMIFVATDLLKKANSDFNTEAFIVWDGKN